jgi:predicted DNA-binding protein (MmcQ/YjbR family)
VLPKGPRRNPSALEKALRKHALSFPEAYEEFPWGERAFKVRKKVFVFLGADREALSMSVKLPESSEMALELPFAQPTGYGLGKSGWVTVRFSEGEKAPMFVLEGWIAESYRAVAPKALAQAASAARASRARPKRRS